MTLLFLLKSFSKSWKLKLRFKFIDCIGLKWASHFRYFLIKGVIKSKCNWNLKLNATKLQSMEYKNKNCFIKKLFVLNSYMCVFESTHTLCKCFVDVVITKIMKLWPKRLKISTHWQSDAKLRKNDSKYVHDQKNILLEWWFKSFEMGIVWLHLEIGWMQIIWSNYESFL